MVLKGKLGVCEVSKSQALTLLLLFSSLNDIS